jgi:hypothetical protein
MPKRMFRASNKKFLLANCTLFFCAWLSTQQLAIASGNNQPPVRLNSSNWQIRTDSGWPGASHGQIKKLKDNPQAVEFVYQLKATRSWPWPEIDFWINFKEACDLSGYKGIRLIVSSKQKDEVYVYFMVEDKNLKILKPLMHKCFLTANSRQEISLLFSDFKIAKDWSPRNPGFSSMNEWNKVMRFGIHKKGHDQEKGSILIEDFKFLPSLSVNKNTKIERTMPPRHYLINLKDNSRLRCRDTIMVSRLGSVSIGPYFYGANWGVWLDLPDKQKTASLGLKILRAGGPFMDRYDWRSLKFTFPGNGKEITMVSLDEFIKYCRDIGAEPLIQINALGLSPVRPNSQIDEKSITELVRYLNKDRGYGVKFFEIGNEPFIWHKVHFDLRDKPCSVREYFEIFKKISLCVKNTQAQIDPAIKIKIFAPSIETSWLNWGSLSEKDKQKPVLGEFLKMCKDFEKDKTANPKGIRILDVLSFHLFPSFKEVRSITRSAENSFILQSTQTWWNRNYVNKYDTSLPIGQAGGIIPKLKELIKNNYPGIELAVTEFNIESESMVDYDPLIKVLYLSDIYGILAKSGVDYSVQFCLNSSDQNIALIDDLDNITPLYYPLALYAKYFNGIILDAKSSLPEKLNVYACSNNTDIIIMAVNKDNIAHKTRVLVDCGRQKKISFVHIFPALSLTCLKITGNNPNFIADCWEYGRQQINRNISNNPDL